MNALRASQLGLLLGNRRETAAHLITLHIPSNKGSNPSSTCVDLISLNGDAFRDENPFPRQSLEHFSGDSLGGCFPPLLYICGLLVPVTGISQVLGGVECFEGNFSQCAVCLFCIHRCVVGV
jgi:hypothetical protein